MMRRDERLPYPLRLGRTEGFGSGYLVLVQSDELSAPRFSEGGGAVYAFEHVCNIFIMCRNQ